MLDSPSNQPPSPPIRRVRRHAGLEAPQFRLSTLMVLVTGASVLLAASLVLHPLTTFALVLLSLGILAHVAGNFYGTKLRDQATELIRTGQRADRPLWEQAAVKPSVPSRLNDRSPVGIALVFFVLVGMACGATGGSYWLSVALAAPLSWADFGMGCFAFGALGAMAGFALGGFVCIGYRVIRQVEEQDRRPEE